MVAAWHGFGNIAQSSNSFSNPTAVAHRDVYKGDSQGPRSTCRRLSSTYVRRHLAVHLSRDDRNVVAQTTRSTRKRKSLEVLDDRHRLGPSLVG